MKKLLLPLFLVLCILTLVGEFGQWTNLIFATKPFLMVVLSLYFYLETKAYKSSFQFWILLGFIFSIAGDTFLMFVENPPFWESFFLFGLGSFLVTHVAYIIAFAKYPSFKSGLLAKSPLLGLPFILFLATNIYIMWDGVPEEMKIPVVIYSSAITLMAVTGLNMSGRIGSKAFKVLFVGVLLFVISDTFIGLNKFVMPDKIPFVRLIIMSAYLLGQYFIAKGSILLLQSENKSS